MCIFGAHIFHSPIQFSFNICTKLDRFCWSISFGYEFVGQVVTRITSKNTQMQSARSKMLKIKTNEKHINTVYDEQKNKTANATHTSARRRRRQLAIVSSFLFRCVEFNSFKFSYNTATCSSTLNIYT